MLGASDAMHAASEEQIILSSAEFVWLHRRSSLLAFTGSEDKDAALSGGTSIASSKNRECTIANRRSKAEQDGESSQHLALLPSRDPSLALCVKVGGDRPSFDPPECVKCGCDRPTWRPPLDLTVTAVSALKIRKFSAANKPTAWTTRRRYDA